MVLSSARLVSMDSRANSSLSVLNHQRISSQKVGRVIRQAGRHALTASMLGWLPGGKRDPLELLCCCPCCMVRVCARVFPALMLGSSVGNSIGECMEGMWGGIPTSV